MSRKEETDSAGRKQPSPHRRKRRAVNAAKQRWKDKCQLTPGKPKSWSERSYANKLKHMAAARKGGATTGSQIKAQQDLFWRFYHGGCKERLDGPFKAVVDTFERIEAAYAQRYGQNGPKSMAWEGFFAQMLYSFVFAPCWTKKPEDLERDMWALYERYMEADEATLWESGLMDTLVSYEQALDQKRFRLAQWRDKNRERASGNS